jgi:hypothetical protein
MIFLSLDIAFLSQEIVFLSMDIISLSLDRTYLSQSVKPLKVARIFGMARKIFGEAMEGGGGVDGINGVWSGHVQTVHTSNKVTN